ncbi:MAG: hypothetical protein A2X95_03085 [Syntrophobacterales bacterium GWF2_56_9]|nr:MAG: hypothetical protein A2X95_03085 [Syntrophobacterales bacterium GWF2_56_9]
MAILLTKTTKVLTQGITGREGSLRAKFMRSLGTNIVAGVTPGRGGEEVDGIPDVITHAGLGISTVIHVGTEPVTGMSFSDILPLFQEDPETDAVAIFGEIGGSHEEEAADLVQSGKFTKPIIIYVSGAWAPAGTRFSHASSIVERGKGSAQDKVTRLREAGIIVADRPNEIAERLLELKQQGKLRVK